MNIDKTIANFGKRIKKLRKERSLTQSELANLSGVSRRAIANYEAAAKIPPTDKLLKLASAFGMTADQLLGIKKVTYDKTEISATTLKKARQIDKLSLRSKNKVFSLVRELTAKYEVD